VNIDQLINPEPPPIPRNYEHGGVLLYIENERLDIADPIKLAEMREQERRSRRKEVQAKNDQRRIERKRSKRTDELIADGYVRSTEAEFYKCFFDAMAGFPTKRQFAEHHGFKPAMIANQASRSDRPSVKVCALLGFVFVTQRKLKRSSATGPNLNREYWRKK